MLMDTIPFGTSCKNCTTVLPAASVSADGAGFPLRTVSVRPGSETACSARNAASSPETRVCTAGSFAGSTARTARAEAGMALSFRPLSAETMRSGTILPMAANARPSRMAALARPLSISVPEWPPVRPVSSSTTVGSEQTSDARGSRTLARAPPAQLTVKMPSSSESMFRSRRAVSGETSRPAAPSMPISSSTVKTASMRGWRSVLSSIAASAIAIAMPSSPPSVVPRA